jgi:hypothetical protein
MYEFNEDSLNLLNKSLEGINTSRRNLNFWERLLPEGMLSSGNDFCYQTKLH